MSKLPLSLLSHLSSLICPSRYLLSSVMQRTLRCLPLNSSEGKSGSFPRLKGTKIWHSSLSSGPLGCVFNGCISTSPSFTSCLVVCACVCVSVCRDSLLASLLDGVRASGNRDVCVKMAPTQRGQRWGLLSMPVDEEVESLHLKFLAAPPSKSETFRHMTVTNSNWIFKHTFKPDWKLCSVICLIVPSLPPLLRWKLCRCSVQIQCQHILQWSPARSNTRRECASVCDWCPPLCSHAHSLPLLYRSCFFSPQGLFSENKEKLINNAILALLSQEAELPALNAELESHFQAIRRLVASKAGFQAFTQLPK